MLQSRSGPEPGNEFLVIRAEGVPNQVQQRIGAILGIRFLEQPGFGSAGIIRCRRAQPRRIDNCDSPQRGGLYMDLEMINGLLRDGPQNGSGLIQRNRDHTAGMERGFRPGRCPVQVAASKAVVSWVEVGASWLRSDC